MPGKTPEPWYREGKKAWYVWHDGKQRRLGKSKEEAFRQFHLLMAGEKPTPKPKPTPEPKPAGLTVEALA